MKNQKGFSVIEHLVVAAIVGIIAAIAIPNLLSSRRAANEASAVSNLRTVHMANATFAATQNTNGYFAPNFAGLTSAPGLLDDSWTGRPVKNTYIFAYSVNSATAPTAYCVRARSVDVSAKQYAVATDGTIYSGTTAAPVTCAAGVRSGGTVVGS